MKMSTIMILGLFGSDLKVWCISGSFPYRRGFSVWAVGALGSFSVESVKAAALYPLDEPKDAITMEAERDDELRMN